ncbi:MAG: alpha-glucan family phosphorylase [Aggregatilineales bacterium]
MVKPVATIRVEPNLPAAIERLREVAYNLRWAWDEETIALFRRLDRDLWEATNHNPVLMLGQIDQSRLEAATEDAAFMAHYHRVLSAFDAYMNPTSTWFDTQYAGQSKPVIAYFSMEFGLTECLQNYSGGLGVLSGDHLKSASDLGVPLVGVGLLYQEGYFRQYLNADGYQQELYPLNDFANQPITLERDAEGKPLLIDVPLPGRKLYAHIWRVQVGRVPLYLLDTNCAENVLEEDRNLTDRLYGGDRRTRIRQEILMGIGGIRALEALGLKPDICHMNEGHSAFLALERIRKFMKEHDVTFEQAQAITSASNVFTTHTPVPAGLERFGFDLIDEHFTDYMAELGLTREEFIDLGREDMGDYQLFSMPVLAFRLSASANGVAKLHGAVCRAMWQWMYPQVPEHEVPISSVTNGIHVQSWISRDMAMLLDRYLDPAWRNEEWRADLWAGIDMVPDTEIWRTHERRRERLVVFARKRLRWQLKRRGASQHEIMQADEVLDPDALTIGFARRFATYKRATLLFRDPARLSRILNHPDRPVQIIFAGKAHPHDTAGKDLIRQIANLAREPEFRRHLVFLEDYDMLVARLLVQGCDVWLNTPRRPQEASGTSGMKVIYNGGLNCSVLDGWWDEGYSPDVGWAIGNGEEYSEAEQGHQDYVESEALYNLLEHAIVPLFYDRGPDGLPREWVSKIKNNFRLLAPYFNTHRMVQEYCEYHYMPDFLRSRGLTEPDIARGLDYAQWLSDLKAAWQAVRIERVDVAPTSVRIGTPVEVKAHVLLGQLKPEDVLVQLYYGPLTTRGDVNAGSAVTMQPLQPDGQNGYIFATTIAYETSGERGVSVRVLPNHPCMPTPFKPGIIRWA